MYEPIVACLIGTIWVYEIGIDPDTQPTWPLRICTHVDIFFGKTWIVEEVIPSAKVTRKRSSFDFAPYAIGWVTASPNTDKVMGCDSRCCATNVTITVRLRGITTLHAKIQMGDAAGRSIIVMPGTGFLWCDAETSLGIFGRRKEQTEDQQTKKS